MTIRLDREIEAKYEVLAIMGEGGMGAVYKVRHRYLEEIQVIKLMREKFQVDETLKARFLREAKTANKVRHPNIAELIDYDVTSEGTAFIVMEFIEGVNLRELMKRSGGAFDVPFVVDAGLQTLSALACLHEKGFVHRDISPDNLMLTTRDGKNVIKLIDLGIAKSMETTGNLTMDGKFVGKVFYASPEQLGGSEIDRRSDFYSLGVTLYEMVTGAAPIAGSDYRAIISGHLTRPPRSFEETDPKGLVPGALRGAILKALQKDPDDRYDSAESFAAALRAAQTPGLDPSSARTIELSGDASDRPTEVSGEAAAATVDALPVHLAPTTVPKSTASATQPNLMRRRPFIAGVAMAIVFLAAVIAMTLRSRPEPQTRTRPAPPSGQTVTVSASQSAAPVATGDLIIKGLPWGEVVEVVDSAGRDRVAAKPLYTPAALSLPAGSYRVVVSNPFSSRRISIDAVVKAAAPNNVEARFDEIDAADYLRSVMP